MADIDALEHWLTPLIAQLGPQQRRKLARDVARDLRTENARTMRAQTGPDGQPWLPRKAQARATRGKLRTLPMFTKMRQARHLRMAATPSEAVVQFLGRTERIARVHHFGLRDRVTQGGPQYDYPARPLLGIPQGYEQRLRERIIDHLAGRT